MTRKSNAPGYPEATAVGDHLVIDKTEWVPGPDPEPHRRDPDRDAYPESYLYCLRCGVEALAPCDLPPTCDADIRTCEESGDADRTGGSEPDPAEPAEPGDPDRAKPADPNGVEPADPARVGPDAPGGRVD